MPPENAYALRMLQPKQYRQLREELGLSRAKAARLIDRHESWVYRLERGKGGTGPIPLALQARYWGALVGTEFARNAGITKQRGDD